MIMLKQGMRKWLGTLLMFCVSTVMSGVLFADTVTTTIKDITNTIDATLKIRTETDEIALTTFDQRSTDAPVRAENLPLNLVRLALHDPIWSETFGGLPIDTVGDTMTITSITIPDLGDPLNERVEKLEILDANGEILATSGAGERSETATLRLASEKNTYVMAYETTYTFTGTATSPLPLLDCHNDSHSLSYFIRFVPTANATEINIPVFTNHASTRTDADATEIRVTDTVTTTPYLTIKGQTTFDVVELGLANAGAYSLNTVITEAQTLHGPNTGETAHNIDTYNHLILVRAWEQGTVLEVDAAISKAEIVFASTCTTDETGAAPTLRFKEGTSFTGALSVRDASKDANGNASTAKGTVRFEYDATTAGAQELVIPTSVFSPFSFTQKCDVELASYPQKVADKDIDPATKNAGEGTYWFWRNPFTVPSGRTLRLVTCTDTQLTRLPNVAFEDATSILDLDFDSTNHASHEMAEAIGRVIDSSSGTLVINSAAFSHLYTDPAQGTVTMGTEVCEIHGMPTEQTIHTYNDLTMNGSFVIANGQGTMADIIQHTGITTVGRTSTEETTYNDYFRFGRGSTSDGSALGAARAVYEMKAGELKVPGTLLFSNRIQVGRLTIGDGVAFKDGKDDKATATIGTLLSHPETITEGTPNLGQSLATTVSGVATVEIKSDGHLKLANDLDFTPPDKSFFYLEGGTLEATTANTEFTFGTDTMLGGGLRLRGDKTNTIIGKDLKIDAVTGDGDLVLDGTVTIGELRDFRGKVEVADKTVNSTDAGIISSISGVRSVITFGNLGATGTVGVANILTMAQACDYRGSLAFAVDTYQDLRIDQVDIVTFRHAFRIQEKQEVTIRLDQFADAIFAWPDDITEENAPTLTIVEAGAYGGRVVFPHIPQGVNVKFQYYNEAGNLQDHDAATWKITVEESGATDILSWENPHVSGKAAWIDIEFDGNTKNTGWLKLGEDDAALIGLSGHTDHSSPTENIALFEQTHHPVSYGLPLYLRPYIDPKKTSNDWGLVFPEVWSAAIRMAAPETSNKVVMSMGCLPVNNNNTTGDSLTLATGTVNTTDETTELILWHITGDSTAQMNRVATATVRKTDDVLHVFSMVCDGTSIRVYLDGNHLTTYTPTTKLTLGTGLQCGQLLEEPNISAAVKDLCGNVDDDDGGMVDYIRFFKGELTDEAMRALSEEAPAIDRFHRFTRTVTADGDWVQTGAWKRQTLNESTSTWTDDNGTYDEPLEGAAVLIYCNGDHMLEVNVQKNKGAYFFSKNRIYSMLTVRPTADATADARLVLVPICDEEGKVVGAIDTQAEAEKSPWLNNHVTLDGRDDYQYGTLYFTGDYATDDLSANTMSLVLKGNIAEGSASNITLGKPNKPVAPTTYTEEITGFLRRTLTQTREVTQTCTATRTINVNGSQTITLSASAGVINFQDQATVFLGAVGTSGETCTQSIVVERTLTQTRTATAWFTTPTIAEDASWSPTYTYNETTGATTGFAAFSTNDLPSEGWEIVASEATGALRPTVLEMMADFSVIRGRAEMESSVACLAGPITGPGITRGNTAKDAEGNSVLAGSQVSEHVWVPPFGADDEWHLSDVTETYYSPNVDGKTNGLFVKITQIPGRLYLDTSSQELVYESDGKTAYFSKQPWYRYGYKGTTLESGETPIPAVAKDFGMAVAFQIKTSYREKSDAKGTETNEVILTLNTTKDAKKDAETDNISVFRVDLPDGYKTGDAVPTLTLKNPNAHSIRITNQLITFARLEDLEGALTIQEGALIHGHTTGTYAFKNHKPSWLIKDSTVANLEVHGEDNAFGGSVELHDTNLILADDATLHQSNPDAHLWMKSLTLGDGATFNFEARGADAETNGVIFTDRVTLTGTSATLFGGGDLGSDENVADVDLASHFTAAGFTALQANTTLTVHSAPLEGTSTPAEIAAKPNRWICYTADFQTATEDKVDADGNPVQVPLGGFGLTKTGPGTMAFRDINPPSLSGPVSVNAGILRVGGKAAASDALIHDQHLTNAIGHHGLHVAAGATLAANRYTPEDYVIACLEGGQTLSGTGTIDGDVRLCSGATIDGSDGIGMTVRRFVLDGSATSDVTVTLPEDLTVNVNDAVSTRPTLFYLLEDSVRSETRRRFNAKRKNAAATESRWDVVGEHAAGESAADESTVTWAARYYVEPPYLPVPVAPDTPEGNTYAENIEKTFILYYQSYGVANLLTAQGITKGDSYKLNASEIGDAFSLFSNIWTFAEDTDPTTVDSSHLLMAYDFGIARQTIRRLETGNTTNGTEETALYVILEVALENTLEDVFKETYGTLEGGTTKADFHINTLVKIYNQDDDEMPATEILGWDATTLESPTVATRTPGRRYYAIPFTTENFPYASPSTTTTLSVKASLPK